MTMANIVFIIVLVVIFVIVTFVFPRRGVRRAIPTVIQIFRQHNAVGSHNAKTFDELGFKSTKKSVIRMMFSKRDYRPDALVWLVKANVVQKTEDDKLYLSDKDLAATKWKDH